MTPAPPRIALVSREYPPFFGGGIGTYARWIVPALADRGVQVHVITQAYDRTNPRVEINGPVTVHRVPISMGKGGWTNTAIRFSVQAARVVQTLHRTGRIDAAEFAECEGAGLATLLADRDRPATIVQLHTPSEQLFVLRSLSSQKLDTSLRTYFECERMALHLADAVLAPSAFIADWAHKRYDLSRAPSVIPYARGPLPPTPPPAPADEPTTVFYAGRIEPRKGVESLILAFNAVSRRHPEVCLRLAGADTSGAPGGGSMRAYLESLLEPHAKARVRFLGRLRQDALREEYARALICTIPSLWENFPNTCIESMSHARAVLVSDEGGMKEMIGDTDAGRTFHAGQEDDLARVLDEMLREPRDRLIERGRIARARIEHLCDPARVAEQRVRHFERVIAQREEARRDRRRNEIVRSWSTLESLCVGQPPQPDLPEVSRGVQQWVQRIGVQPC